MTIRPKDGDLGLCFKIDLLKTINSTSHIFNQTSHNYFQPNLPNGRTITAK